MTRKLREPAPGDDRPRNRPDIGEGQYRGRRSPEELARIRADIDREAAPKIAAALLFLVNQGLAKRRRDDARDRRSA